MRKTVTGVALVAALALLTGCGSSDDGEGSGEKSGKKEGSSSGAAAKPGGDADAGGSGKGAAHQVTLEVGGQGKTQIMYVSDTNHMEQVTLPWKKTFEITLEGAEKKVGHVVSVVPGSVQGGDGMLSAAPCTITVDGDKVSDNDGGKAKKPMCEHMLK
ncbi:hypothetical protein [Streptomyces sp. NPDC047123]|uniref:hypothetical protein n=1 Tax=Streptomyces sp. NPDC047123 TaxID=3155622 RepID=UPI0033F2035E